MIPVKREKPPPTANSVDKVEEASMESFPASDPPAFVAGKDRAIPSRKALDTQENVAAMVDYHHDRSQQLARMHELRALRLSRPKGGNKFVRGTKASK